MQITKIKKLSNGKYNILLDNSQKIITYDEAIINNNILYKKEIDSNLLNKLNMDTKYYDIYNKVIKLISIRIRSEKEINEYLDKNLIEEKQKKEIIDKLKDNNLLNDKNFTKAFIMDKINLSNIGPVKIKKELLGHNIDEELINGELDNVDNSIYIEKINKIINKKLKTNTKYSHYILKQKLMNDLINQGFYRDDINSCLNNIVIDNDILIEKYYDKIFKKLCLKYDGNILYQKIKEKLYQKGFSLSEIENIINKKIGD